MFLLVLLSSLLGCTNDYPGAMDDPKPAAEVIQVKDLNGTVSVSSGIYDLEFYVRGTDSATIVVTTGGKRSATMLDADVWHRGFVRGITATGNKLQVSGTLLDASASFELKAAYLRKAEHTRTFIKGGNLRLGCVYTDYTTASPFRRSILTSLNPLSHKTPDINKS